MITECPHFSRECAHSLPEMMSRTPPLFGFSTHSLRSSPSAATIDTVASITHICAFQETVLALLVRARHYNPAWKFFAIQCHVPPESFRIRFVCVQYSISDSVCSIQYDLFITAREFVYLSWSDCSRILRLGSSPTMYSRGWVETREVHAFSKETIYLFPSLCRSCPVSPQPSLSVIVSPAYRAIGATGSEGERMC